MKVNDWDLLDLENEILVAVTDYTTRNEISDWELGVSFVDNQGIRVNLE